MSVRKTNMIIVGTGGMAREHIKRLLLQRDTTRIVAVSEPNAAQYAASAQLFRAAGVRPPPNEPDLQKLLSTQNGQLDAAFIITPHVYHHAQATMCLRAGLDVLLEKPMVMNAGEARDLIKTRNEAARLLTVAFQSSLSRYLDRAIEWIRAGAAGQITAIHASVWQSWKSEQTGTWRQNPALSGGGFLFDTGAHLLNSIVRLADCDFTEVSAFMDNRGAPVDILTSAMGRLANGALVTIGACGDTVTSCAANVKVFGTKMLLETDVWGDWLRVQRQGSRSLRAVKLPPTRGVWEQFLAVRRAEIPNPSPPELGLRLALLWDALQASARLGGKRVRVPSSDPA